MAPTICSEKDYRGRGRVQRQSNINNYGGKITHRRSIAARNAKSIKFSLVNAFENDTTMYDSDSNHSPHHHININHNNSNQNSMDIIKNEHINTESEDFDNNEIYMQYNAGRLSSNSIQTPTSSTTTTSFSYLNAEHKTLNSSALQQSPSKFIYCKYSYRMNEISSSTTSESSTAVTSSSTINNEIRPVYQHRDYYYDDDSHNDDAKIQEIFNHKILTFNNMNENIDCKSSNTKGLVDIALKTVTLIRRNQLLQKKLLQLQVETKEFIESVMANPENQALCQKQLLEQSVGVAVTVASPASSPSSTTSLLSPLSSLSSSSSSSSQHCQINNSSNNIYNETSSC